MKYKGRKIAGSSLLTILGVVCFATVLVSAAALSVMIATTSHNVQATGETLTIYDSTTSSHGTYWESGTTWTAATDYYIGVHAAPQGVLTNYKLIVKISTDGALAPLGTGTLIDSQVWAVGGTFRTASLTFSYDVPSKTWTSTTMTPVGLSDNIEIWFTTGIFSFSGTLVTLNIQAVTV